MPKHLILFVLAYSLYSTEVIEFILIYFLTGLCVLHFPTFISYGMHLNWRWCTMGKCMDLCGNIIHTYINISRVEPIYVLFVYFCDDRIVLELPDCHSTLLAE